MKINSIKLYIIIISAVFFTTGIMAQEDSTLSKKRQWMNDFREFKRDFLIREVNLSHKQQEEFFPLYTEMEKEIYEVNKDARDIEKKISSSTNISDAEYNKTAEKLLKVKTEEAEIEAQYFTKFQKILSGKQLFLLKRAETRFSKNMLQHHKGTSKK